jgi:hypothetical protein
MAALRNGLMEGITVAWYLRVHPAPRRTERCVQKGVSPTARIHAPTPPFVCLYLTGIRRAQI